MKKVIFIFGVLFLVVLISIAISISLRDDKNIKIGVILPLTGDGSKYGEEARRGIEIAWENASISKPMLRYEDDQGLPSMAVAAFQRLIASGNVPLVIGGMYSSTALAIAPIAERKKIILFSPSASTPDLSKAGDYIFRNWPSDIYEGEAMATFVFMHLKQRNVAVLGQSLDYALGITKEFKKKYEAIGGKIIAEEYYTPGTADFRTALSKLKSMGAQCVYLPGMYAEIAIILRQQKELGFQPLNISCVGFDNSEAIRLAGDSAEGTVFARPAYDPRSTNDEVRLFVDAFRAKYKTDPGVYAAHAYDATRIVLIAIDNGRKTPEDIKKALYNIRDFPGVTGATTIDQNGDVLKPIQFMKVHDHAFVNFFD